MSDELTREQVGEVMMALRSRLSYWSEDYVGKILAHDAAQRATIEKERKERIRYQLECDSLRDRLACMNERVKVAEGNELLTRQEEEKAQATIARLELVESYYKSEQELTVGLREEISKLEARLAAVTVVRDALAETASHNLSQCAAFERKLAAVTEQRDAALAMVRALIPADYKPLQQRVAQLEGALSPCLWRSVHPTYAGYWWHKGPDGTCIRIVNMASRGLVEGLWPYEARTNEPLWNVDGEWAEVLLPDEAAQALQPPAPTKGESS